MLVVSLVTLIRDETINLDIHATNRKHITDFEGTWMRPTAHGLAFVILESGITIQENDCAIAIPSFVLFIGDFAPVELVIGLTTALKVSIP